jgi:hypothetical protein
MILYEYNCEKKQLRVLAVAQYDKEHKTIENHQDDSATWHYVIPDSVSEKVFREVCNK